MKILVATNKYDTEYYLYDTPEQQALAALNLFKTNDGLSYYQDISEPDLVAMEKQIEELTLEIDKSVKADISDSYIAKLRTKLSAYQRQVKEDKVQSELYVKALAGDAQAAFKLIKLRKDAEYEGWEVKEVK